MVRAGELFTVIGVAILVMSGGLIGYWVAPGESGDGGVDVYFQVSTYERLNEGHYEGIISLDQLLDRGDFGIGTVEGIDGEMMILDGVAYRAGTDLAPEEVAPGTMIPFAMVTDFDPTAFYSMADIDDYQELKAMYADMAAPPAVAMAVMIHTEFRSITIRSVPGQQAPYPPLSEVVAGQVTLQLHGVRGTVMGFIMADGLGGINLAGFHMHFLSDDLSLGGHVLDLSFEEADMCVEMMTSITLVNA